jgi:hypothetical protein
MEGLDPGQGRERREFGTRIHLDQQAVAGDRTGEAIALDSRHGCQHPFTESEGAAIALRDQVRLVGQIMIDNTLGRADRGADFVQ